jgi:probable F420-dependent oxidoreductase
MISFGVSLFPTEYTLPPAEFAKAVEERGLDAIFFPEHTHIPTSRKTPWPGGADLPKHYLHTHDPFVALAACAAVTSRIQLGFGVCLVTQRDPIMTAKQVASLDLISGGRVIFGVGAGWNREEMENHGTPFKMRWPILRERVLAMKTIWREEEASFHGTHVDFDPIWSYPKPARAGGPPVWLGAKSRYITERVAEYGDGFMPIFGREGQASIAQLKEACARRGRDFSEIALASFGPPPTEAASVQCINEGYTHLIYVLPAAEPAKVLAKLDQLAELVSRLRA